MVKQNPVLHLKLGETMATSTWRDVMVHPMLESLSQQSVLTSLEILGVKWGGVVGCCGCG